MLPIVNAAEDNGAVILIFKESFRVYREVGINGNFLVETVGFHRTQNIVICVHPKVSEYTTKTSTNGSLFSSKMSISRQSVEIF